MKKKMKLALLSFAILAMGITGVYAAQQVLFKDTNFNLSSGQAYHRTALNASWNQALADITVDTVTSGTKKNTFMVSRYENGKYVVKAVLVSGFAQYTCNQINLGYIGHGNWMYTDVAGDPSTGESWAGWGGTTEFRSF